MAFLRNIILGLLLLLMMVQTITPLGWSLYYAANRDYITKNFCVNKNKPSMHCNGKCYLAKKMKQAEENEKNEKEGYQFAFFPVFIKEDIHLQFGCDGTQKYRQPLHLPDLYKFITCTDFFHPPSYV